MPTRRKAVSARTQGDDHRSRPTNTHSAHARRAPEAYTDLTDRPVKVGAGSAVTIAPEWKGNWMHAYVYIDLNNDGKFDASSPNSPEVVASPTIRDRPRAKTDSPRRATKTRV